MIKRIQLLISAILLSGLLLTTVYGCESKNDLLELEKIESVHNGQLHYSIEYDLNENHYSLEVAYHFKFIQGILGSVSVDYPDCCVLTARQLFLKVLPSFDAGCTIQFRIYKDSHWEAGKKYIYNQNEANEMYAFMSFESNHEIKKLITESVWIVIEPTDDEYGFEASFEFDAKDPDGVEYKIRNGHVKSEYRYKATPNYKVFAEHCHAFRPA